MDQPLPWGRMQGVRPSKPFHWFVDEGLSFEQAALRMQEAYGVSPEKTALLCQIGPYTDHLLRHLDRRAVSVYLGVPFCPTRCLYCSFPSHSLRQLGQAREQFATAVIEEAGVLGSYLNESGRPIDAVYLGGGTPTALAPRDLDRVLTALENVLPRPWQEYTVEAGRPETLTDEQLAVLQTHQVQRISINPQTSNDRTLQAIGRQHCARDVEAAYTQSRDLFPVINMDLILGLPGEGLGDVQASLRWVLGMRPENITLHMFSPKRASRFSAERTLWIDQLPSAGLARQMTAWCYQRLAEAGYQPYYLYRQRDILGGQENIGWALPGTECRYNALMISERQHILGLGGAAGSKFVHADGSLESVYNPKDVLVYLERLPELIAHKLQLLGKLDEQE